MLAGEMAILRQQGSGASGFKEHSDC